jgi:siroheme synthase
MGVAALPALARELIAHGLPADMPAAAIERGTTPEQRVICGTLATLPELAAAEGLKPPALTIVGEVVKLHRRLAWFEPQRDACAIEEVA